MNQGKLVAQDFVAAIGHWVVEASGDTSSTTEARRRRGSDVVRSDKTPWKLRGHTDWVLVVPGMCCAEQTGVAGTQSDPQPLCQVSEVKVTNMVGLGPPPKLSPYFPSKSTR